LSLDTILADLKSERDRLEKAITALEGITRGASAGRSLAAPIPLKRGRRKMAAAERERLSEVKKAWWAKKKAAASKLGPAKRRAFSAATRSKMAKAQKARWAKVRQQDKAKS